MAGGVLWRDRMFLQEPHDRRMHAPRRAQDATDTAGAQVFDELRVAFDELAIVFDGVRYAGAIGEREAIAGFAERPGLFRSDAREHGDAVRVGITALRKLHGDPAAGCTHLSYILVKNVSLCR